MADEKPDELQQAFLDYVKMVNPPDERPEEGSRRWKELRGAYMAGARYGVEAMAAADPDAMNEQRAEDDRKLAANVREATIAEIAKSDEVIQGRISFAQRCSARITKLFDLSAPEEVIRNEVKMLQQRLNAIEAALSTPGEQKPSREGVCPSCGGHGVVRVPIASGPYMSIAERESRDNEGGD